MKCGLVTALLLFAPGAALAQQGPLEAIDACTARLDPDVDVGYERIAARCPELVRRLEESGWSAWLPRDWKNPGNDLSAGGLRELRVLAERELKTPAPAHTLRIERLNGILARLGPTSREHDGWWTRFKAWLREILERREEAPPDGWLARMIAHVGFSQTLIELISYAALVLVVVLAGVILFNELRSAGVFRPRGRPNAGQGASRPAARAGGPSWNDIERAPFPDKPRLLLGLIAARLLEQNRLPPVGGLTVRELTRAARLPEDSDRQRLAEIARTAERVRYSDREVTPGSIEPVLASGRELLEHLDSSGPDRDSRANPLAREGLQPAGGPS